MYTYTGLTAAVSMRVPGTEKQVHVYTILSGLTAKQRHDDCLHSVRLYTLVRACLQNDEPLKCGQRPAVFVRRRTLEEGAVGPGG